MHRNALGRRVWDSGAACWTVCLANLPVKPARSRYVKLTVGPVFRSRLAKLLSSQRHRSSRCLADLLRPSMKRDVFQLFLTRSGVRSFSVSFVSIAATSWSLTEFLFLDFHIAHIVIVIRMRILSEALL